MSTPKDGGPAFPSGDNDSPSCPYPYEPGMSRRDYFAAAALPACIAWLREQERDKLLTAGEPGHSQPYLPEDPDDDEFNAAANSACLFADAMLRTLENS